jgi:O-antigen/teichoic acid export membrane protein
LRRLARDGVIAQSALAFTATMLPSVFFFVYHFALSRQLGVERYGSLSSLISLLTIAVAPAGIAAIVTMKYTAEFKAVEDWPKLQAFGYRALQAGGAAALAALVVTLVASPAVAWYLRVPDVVAVELTGLALAFNLVLPLARAVLQGVQDYGRFAISTTLDAVGRAVFGIALVHAGFGLRGAVGGIAIASALSLIYTIFAALGPLRGSRERVKLDLRRLVQSSAGVALATLFMTLIGFVDLPMVKHFFSPQDAGLYGAASLAGKVVLYALGFVPILVIPKAASRVVRGQPTPIVWISALAVTFAVSVPALLILAFAPVLVLQILTGSAFVAAAPLLLMYGSAMALMAGSNALVAYNIAVHRFHFLVPVGIAAAGEVGGIQLFHQSLTQVLFVLIAANAVGCVGTLMLSVSPRAIPRAAVASG